MEDQMIIALYEARDENAIRETNIKYGDYCHTIAMRILSDHEDAEECVSDTWLHTWNSIPPQKPTSLKFFLAKITRNLSFNRYKEKTRIKRGGGEIALALDELQGVLEGSADVENDFLLEEKKRAIDKFLFSLPRRDCDVFLRRYFYVESTAAIAKRYGIRESNVRVILFRTRQKLKEFLEKENLI